MAKKILRFNGYRVELDSAQIFPDDPGAGTPAMVYGPSGESGTYWCCADTGEIDCGNEALPRDVCEWLDSIADEVNDFVEKNAPVRS